MKRWLFTTLAAAALCTGPALYAHGGTYRGPGDTVPPSGGGAATPTAPTAPTTPTAPSAPTAATPAAPATPTTPAVAPTPTVTTTPVAVTQGASVGPDLTTWEFWWEFNKEPFLNLKAKVQSEGIETGESDFLLGMGGGATKKNTRAPSEAQIRGTVVPALKEMLAGVDQNDIVTACMVALAKIGNDPEIPPRFQPFLKDPVQEIRETSALAYGIYQDVEALDTLKSLLLDNSAGRALVGSQGNVDLRTRTFAAYGLGLIAHAVSDPALKQDIADTLWQVLSTDQSSLKDIRVACVVALGLTGLEEPGPMARKLLDWMEDETHDDLVRAHCPNAAAKLLRDSGTTGPVLEESVRRLLAVFEGKNSNVFVRQSAVQALGIVARGGLPPSLAQTVYETLTKVAEKGRDRQEKNFTAIALAYLGAGVADTDPLRGKVTEFLLSNLQKGGTAYRPWAGLGLGVMAFYVQAEGGQISSVVAPALVSRFNKVKNPSERAAYAIALGLMRHEAAQDSLVRAIEDAKDPTFRGYCAVALGLLGAKEHRDYIAKLMLESKRLADLLQQAAIGLGLMSDREVVDGLLGMMQGDGKSSPPLSVLAATATALGFIGDYRSVEPLVSMLRNEQLTPLARAFAAVALGIVADKEDLPWSSKISEDLNYRAAVDTLTDPSTGTGILDIL